MMSFLEINHNYQGNKDILPFMEISFGFSIKAGGVGALRGW